MPLLGYKQLSHQPHLQLNTNLIVTTTNTTMSCIRNALACSRHDSLHQHREETQRYFAAGARDQRLPPRTSHVHSHATTRLLMRPASCTPQHHPLISRALNACSSGQPHGLKRLWRGVPHCVKITHTHQRAVCVSEWQIPTSTLG